MLKPKEISGSQWDGKRYTYLARLCDVYRHCFSRKHEPLNRLFCDLFSISFLCIPRINFTKRLFICAKIINTSVLCYSAKNIRFQSLRVRLRGEFQPGLKFEIAVKSGKPPSCFAENTITEHAQAHFSARAEILMRLHDGFLNFSPG